MNNFKTGDVVKWDIGVDLLRYGNGMKLVIIGKDKGDGLYEVCDGMFTYPCHASKLTLVDTEGKSALVWGYENGYYELVYTYKHHFGLSQNQKKIWDACEPVVEGYHTDYMNSRDRYVSLAEERLSRVRQALKNVLETL